MGLVKNRQLLFKVIGIFLITIAIAMIIIKNKTYNDTLVYEAMGVDAYINTSYINETNKEDSKYHYIAVLEIPDINLKHGLYKKDDKYNDIAYNIQILKESTMPDIINGNLLLAAHSGNSEVSFFNHLNELKQGSQIIIYYNGYKYIYDIQLINTVEKTGYINITRDKYKNAITLITCLNNSDSLQVVYIGYLIDKVAY